MTRHLTTVPFHGASLIVQKGETPETTMVAMKPLVDGMTLDWEGQRKKLVSHPVLMTCTSVLEVQMPGDDQSRPHTFMPLHRLPFWLATLQPNKIRNDGVRQKVVVYQMEAADALFHHFFGEPADASGFPSKREIGGVVKSVVHAQLRDTLPSLLTEMIDQALASDPRRAVLDYCSVRQLLEEGGAEQKSRRRVNRKLGIALRNRALMEGEIGRRCPHSGVWLFPRGFAARCMKDFGNAMVRDHNDAVRGQTALRLVQPRRDEQVPA